MESYIFFLMKFFIKGFVFKHYSILVLNGGKAMLLSMHELCFYKGYEKKNLLVLKGGV